MNEQEKQDRNAAYRGGVDEINRACSFLRSTDGFDNQVILIMQTAGIREMGERFQSSETFPGEAQK